MLRRLVLIAVALAASLAPANAQPAVECTLGTATPGGGFPAYSDALIAAIREVDPTLSLIATATKGSTENLTLLREGKLDLALVQGEYAYDALAAQGDHPGLTVVAPVDTTPGFFAVPASSPIRTIEDLRGRPVALGTRSSGLTVMGRSVLEGSGLDPARDIQPILLDRAGDGPVMVLDGRAAALWGGSLGWPGFKTLAESDGGARFFGPASKDVDSILALRPSLRRLTVPAGSFKGQTEAIDTVGSWSFIMARPGLGDDTVARLVRAIDHGLDALAARYPQGRESDPRNLPSAVSSKWLHPATIAYLREIGMIPR